MKKVLNKAALVFLIILMFFGAFNHIANPAFYDAFIPDFFPKLIVNYASALIEFFIGALLVVPKYRFLGGVSFIALMIGFFPVHIWDLTKDIPAIGSKEAAIIRIVIQFLLIAIAYSVIRKNPKN
jgi:uncharacterized membrane protein